VELRGGHQACHVRPMQLPLWKGRWMSNTSVGAMSGLVGVGYEGRTIGELVSDLVGRGVSRLVDVRLTPISRKPGFSKTALSQALTDAGIDYEHRPELGNPKTNRPGFAGPPAELAEARAIFAALLHRPGSDEALDALAGVARHELVALLCFEADERRCHRDVVLQEARHRAASVSASRPQVR